MLCEKYHGSVSDVSSLAAQPSSSSLASMSQCAPSSAESSARSSFVPCAAAEIQLHILCRQLDQCIGIARV